jgi:type II restriction enzyme
MKLSFETKIAEGYTSPVQKARVFTEFWVSNQAYCPNCGHQNINKYKDNQPVADFYCPKCNEDYELKSKKTAIGTKVVDGAYRTMMERLQCSNNPNLFLLSYDFVKLEIMNFLVVPKHFFIPSMIEKRKPLIPPARRAGWVGCNILLQDVPRIGKIYFIKNNQVEPKEKVLGEWQKTLFLRDEKEISAKGWLLDIMNCIEQLGSTDFTLNDIYKFEDMLSEKHPDNKHIKDKIRQQLQILRNKNYIEFLGKGQYMLR